MGFSCITSNCLLYCRYGNREIAAALRRRKEMTTIQKACEKYGITEDEFEGALNSVSPDSLSEDDIEIHAKWVSEMESCYDE